MPAPRLAAFDGLSRVVSIGSFSKTLSAAIRCGYVAARPEWIEALVDLKLATSFGHAQIGANVVHRLLVDGTYRRHVDSLRARLADAMGETLRRVTRAPGSGRNRAAACSCGRSCPTSRRRTRRAPCAGPRRGARAR